MSEPSGQIWIIDDDPIFRKILFYGIKQVDASLSIVEFGDGEYALEYLEKNKELSGKPQCIFLDINMPLLNGWQFLDALPQIEQYGELTQTRIYVVSSSINPQDRERALNYDVSGFLVKPVRAADLKLILEGSSN